MPPKVSERLLETFIKLDGTGSLRAFLTTSREGNTSTAQPFRTINVLVPNRVVKAGDLVRGKDGIPLLLMDASQGIMGYERFRVLEARHQYDWSRNVKTRDPVAKVDRDMGTKSMGTIYAYFDNPTEVALDKLQDTKYQFYTGQDVKEGDKVDGKTVKRVTRILGVNCVVAE